MSLDASRDVVNVSVVVPVRNRRDLLEQLLGALEAQTRTDFEVIVVDDGSSDGAGEAAAGRIVAGRPVRLLHSHGAGAVKARRIGVDAAMGRILAFTDSDCTPCPGWIEAGAGAIESGADLVNGLTLPARPTNPLERSLGSATEGLYPTANMFFARTCFESIGGFDDSTKDRLGFRHNERARGTGFGEDTIVAWRMIRAGCRVEHVPQAEVRHHVFPPDVVEWLSRSWQTAAFPGLVREVPELRGTIMRRKIFFGNRSRVPFYLTLSALVARRRWLTLLAFTWWTIMRLNDMRRMPDPWREKLPLLPGEMMVDAVTGTAMIVGSARARVVVL